MVLEMPNVNASGTTVRHAVSRALATANLPPVEATYRVLSARAWPLRDGSIGRAEVFLEVATPQPLSRWEPQQLTGWVNPDGEHPLMTLIPGEAPLFVEITPVTWDRWLRLRPERLPDGVEPLCPVTHVLAQDAAAFAQEQGRRLPSAEEFARLWGPSAYPWGDARDPALGRHAAPRFGGRPEVAAHPPAIGLYDLGCWLGHWLEDGRAAGLSAGGEARSAARLGDAPVGFRCVEDATAASLQ